MHPSPGMSTWKKLPQWLCLCICIAFLPTAWAQPVQPTGGKVVAFNSSNFTGTPIALTGVLYQPQEAPKGAIVMIHGSSGWSDHREGHYGRALSRAGYAVLAVDTFGPRGVSSTVEDQGKLTVIQQTRDAFEARRYLIGLGYPADRMAVMGFSRGGVVSMFAADRTFLPAEKERFTLAIPFYPGCNTHPRQPKPASDVFMALGEKDDYTGVKPCQDLAGEYANAGGKVKVKIYPGSTHGFDGNPANTRLYRLSDAESYMDCIIEIDTEGKVHYAGKTFDLNDPAILAETRKTCMKKGASIWSNPAQKDVATRDVIEFLDERLPR
jgi:dienelactone hydrolase